MHLPGNRKNKFQPEYDVVVCRFNSRSLPTPSKIFSKIIRYQYGFLVLDKIMILWFYYKIGLLYLKWEINIEIWLFCKKVNFEAVGQDALIAMKCYR